MGDRFGTSETGHTAAANEVAIITFETLMFSGLIGIKMHDHKGCLNQKVINQF